MTASRTDDGDTLYSHVQLAELLRASELVSTRVADGLAYDLAELLEACEDFHLYVRNLVEDLQTLPEGTERFYCAVADMEVALLEFSHHVPRARRRIGRLSDSVETLPPLAEMTEQERWHVLTTRERYDRLPGLRRALERMADARKKNDGGRREIDDWVDREKA